MSKHQDKNCPNKTYAEKWNSHSCKCDGDHTTYWVSYIFVAGITLMVTGMIFSDADYTIKLGNSICKEKYGEQANYSSYDPGAKKLECNLPVNNTNFDGILVVPRGELK